MSMTSRRSQVVGLLVTASAFGCGSGRANPYSLDVGSDDGGPSFVSGFNDAGSTGALDAYVEQNGIAVKLITLSCSGDCATVEAVGTGGYPPYTFKWDDGSTNATRQICPTSSTNYFVQVTDTGTSGELARAPESVKVPLTANILACPDGGTVACDGGFGAGVNVPASGHYVGTAYCPPDGGVVSFPSLDGGMVTGDVTIDLSIDGDSVSGHVYFQWVPIGAIAGEAALEGSIDCVTGDLGTSWEDGVWGLPGPEAADAGGTVLPTGTVTGTVTAATVAGSPDEIRGLFDYVSAPANVSATCVGTYSAVLVP
jgi:hypothetical protein